MGWFERTLEDLSRFLLLGHIREKVMRRAKFLQLGFWGAALTLLLRPSQLLAGKAMPSAPVSPTSDPFVPLHDSGSGVAGMGLDNYNDATFDEMIADMAAHRRLDGTSFSDKDFS